MLVFVFLIDFIATYFYLDRCLYLYFSSTLLPHTWLPHTCTSISHDSGCRLQLSREFGSNFSSLKFAKHLTELWSSSASRASSLQHIYIYIVRFHIQLYGVSWGTWWTYPALPACWAFLVEKNICLVAIIATAIIVAIIVIAIISVGFQATSPRWREWCKIHNVMSVMQQQMLANWESGLNPLWNW